MSRHQGKTSDGDVVWYEGFGCLNQWQAQVLARVVYGRHVYDLGAGALYYAHKLMELGANRVTAVDKLYESRVTNMANDQRDWKKCTPVGVELDTRTFAEFHASGPQAIDVAFVSWPHNSYGGTMGLELICQKANTVVYLGNNFDGTMCGSRIFWQYLRSRSVLAHAPARRNSLIVFGERMDLKIWQGISWFNNRKVNDDMPADERAAHFTHHGGHMTNTPSHFL